MSIARLAWQWFETGAKGSLKSYPVFPTSQEELVSKCIINECIEFPSDCDLYL